MYLEVTRRSYGNNKLLLPLSAITSLESNTNNGGTTVYITGLKLGLSNIHDSDPYHIERLERIAKISDIEAIDVVEDYSALKFLLLAGQKTKALKED